MSELRLLRVSLSRKRTKEIESSRKEIICIRLNLNTHTQDKAVDTSRKLALERPRQCYSVSRYSKDACFICASTPQRCGNLSQRNQAEKSKQIEGVQTVKEEVKLSLFVDDMILSGNFKR